MKIMSKALVGTLAAGAMAVASANPAMARDRDRGGIDGGDILTGALIIGGIAAVAAATRGDRRDRYDRYDRRYRDYRGGRYDRGYDRRYDNRRGYRQVSQRDAVNMCVYAAEQTAARYSYGGRAEVYDIRDVDRERRGYEVKGRIAVQDRRRGYRNDRWDEGRFTCDVRNGRVVDIDYKGIRGL